MLAEIMSKISIESIVILSLFVSFWSIMLTKKNGPDFLLFKGGSFKFIRENPHWIGIPAMILIMFFVLSSLTSFYIGAPATIIIFLLFRWAGISKYFNSFIGHVLECSACTATWTSLIFSILIVGFDVQLIIFVPAVIGLAFFIMSMCGINDLRDM